MIRSILETNKFTLEVTMPQETQYVAAVLKGGAQALKLRCNADHATPLHNGIRIGSFAERKPFLQQAIDMAGDVPVGLVPGTPELFISRQQLGEMEEMGFDYFNIAPDHLLPFMFDSNRLECVLAVTTDNMSELLLEGIANDPHVGAVEANFVPRESMGTRLVYQDILQYRALAKRLPQPVIATGQRIVKPEELKRFYEAGARCFMLGVVAFRAWQEEHGGGDVTPEACLRLTSLFREAVERL